LQPPRGPAITERKALPPFHPCPMRAARTPAPCSRPRVMPSRRTRLASTTPPPNHLYVWFARHLSSAEKRPVRLRLTLWYGALLALVSLVAALIASLRGHTVASPAARANANAIAAQTVRATSGKRTSMATCVRFAPAAAVSGDLSSQLDAFLAANLSNGVTRCYAVSAVSRDGHESSWSSATHDTPRYDARNLLVYAHDVHADSSGFFFFDESAYAYGEVAAATRAGASDVSALTSKGEGPIRSRGRRVRSVSRLKPNASAIATSFGAPTETASGPKTELQKWAQALLSARV